MATWNWVEAGPGGGRGRFACWDHARQTAEICIDCYRDMEPQDPLWFTHSPAGYMAYVQWGPMCSDCAGKHTKRDIREYAHRLRQFNGRTGRCQGCGRRVYHMFGLRRVKVFYCSSHCESSARAREAKAKRTMERTGKICTVCGDSFEPAKSNAITCSPACRQKAYRRRQALELSDPDLGLE